MGTQTRQAADGTRSMAVFDNSVEVRRPLEEVFDYCSDLRNELEWNPTMQSVELLTSEPPRAGSRYRAKWKGSPADTIQYVEFDRPHRWVATAESPVRAIRFEGRVQETANGSSIATFRLQITARGVLRLFLPVLRRIMKRHEQVAMARLRQALESSAL